MNLSEHLTLAEMTRSQTASRKGIDNTPSEADIANMTRLAEIAYEPACVLLGEDIPVSSGYRSVALNTAVGGAKHSAHTDGRAVDLQPKNVSLGVAFDTLRQSNIPFDQLIIECNAWIHMAIAREGETPRRECLVASGHPGAWKYVPYKAAA